MKSSPHLHTWLSSLSLVSPGHHGGLDAEPQHRWWGGAQIRPCWAAGNGLPEMGEIDLQWNLCLVPQTRVRLCGSSRPSAPHLRGEVHPSPGKSQGPGLDGASGHLWGEAVPVLCVVSPQGVLESGSIQHTLIPHPQRRSPPKEVTMKSLGSDAGHSSGSCRGCDPSTMEQGAPPCLAPAPFSQEFRGVVRG